MRELLIAEVGGEGVIEGVGHNVNLAVPVLLVISISNTAHPSINQTPDIQSSMSKSKIQGRPLDKEECV